MDSFGSLSKKCRLMFLDALASLGLMIIPDSQDRMEIGCPILPEVLPLKLRHQTVTQNSVTQYGMSLKMECQSKWNFTQNGMTIKMEFHSK